MKDGIRLGGAVLIKAGYSTWYRALEPKPEIGIIHDGDVVRVVGFDPESEDVHVRYLPGWISVDAFVPMRFLRRVVNQ